MKQIKIMMISKKKIKRNFFIFLASAFGIYLLMSFYFASHFFFHTEVNGINVSLKAHDDVTNTINTFINDYKLQLIERNGEAEVITSQDIGMHYNKNITISQIHHMQNPFLWIGSLSKRNRHYMKDLYVYDKALLDDKINRLKCFNGNIVEPRNVEFKYMNGTYEFVNEIYGNKIDKVSFDKAINKYISEGKPILDLDKMHCYENPKYTLSSKKALQTRYLLNKYLSTRITYRFGSVLERLDGSTIHHWLKVDENLEVVISKEAITKYIDVMCKKYNTVGIRREFHASTGKIVELNGGLYGWKINRDAEIEALYNNIIKADVLEKEPIYLQKAFSREGNEIGNTYIEINVSKQHLWFYKEGRLIVQGSVVTGNPNRGFATVLGVYMINYKQKEATLAGPGYAAKVTYWMPFFGNIGLHDATWRYRFGGEIYLRNGSHGCVNAPLYLAKTVYNNIEEGTPVILYIED